MRQRFEVVIAVLFFLCCHPGTVERTSTARWKTGTFEALGAVIDAPVGADIQNASEFGVVIAMHRIDPPVGVLDDPTYLLKVSVRRSTKSEIDENRHLLEKEAPEGDQKRWELWMTGLHLLTDVKERGDYTYYRRDVRCGADVLLRVKAEVRTAEMAGKSYKSQDDEIARRMLDSVQCVQSR